MEPAETRELRYFIAVAEELHFGRAAGRLGIAQPPLSRAILQLERRMGVTLIERTSRCVRLTTAGEVLLREGRAALEAVAAAVRRAQRAGRADVGLLHSPQNDLTGLDAEELITERQVVVLPEYHRLARLPSVCLADLAGETMPRWPGTPGSDGDGPVVRDAGQLMQLIALGRMVAVVAESVRGRLHAGLTCRPVDDAPAATIVIAWPAGSTSRHVAEFVRGAAVAAYRRGRLSSVAAAAPD